MKDVRQAPALKLANVKMAQCENKKRIAVYFINESFRTLYMNFEAMN
jgi:hypothetical protein